MPYRAESSTSWAPQTSHSTISATSRENSKVTISIWLLRIVLSIILLLFIMPVALLLTPWWIWLQPFERKCPNMMEGYYRIVTWPLTISKNIRSYREKDSLMDQLKY